MTAAIDPSVGVQAAATRTRVTARLDDGRVITGTLIYWPANSSHRSNGAKARIRLDTGAHLSVATTAVRIHEKGASWVG